MLSKAQRTPDLQKITRYAWQNVFICNECQRGQRSFDKLGYYDGDPRYTDVHRLAAGFTLDQNYVMLKRPLGKETFPVPLVVNEDEVMGRNTHLPSTIFGTPASKISGMLYSIRPYNLIELDNYMLNTVYFERKRVVIEVRYRVPIADSGRLSDYVLTEQVPAWMYQGKRDFWLNEYRNQRLEPVKLYEANKPLGDGFSREHYYFFTEHVENSRK